LARAARLMIQFRVLWQLVNGLIGSILTVIWTCVIIFALIYIFAILGMEIMAPEEDAPEDYQEAVALFHSGLGSCMLTLLQLVTTDSIAAMYRPIAMHKPWQMGYFVIFMLVVSVALMNLVTAVIVDTAIQTSSKDREALKAYAAAEKKAMLPKLKTLFEELDADGSGQLELDEIMDAPESVKEQLEELSNMEDVEGLFKMLDYDNSGSVSVEEFCEGVLKASTDKPVEMMCMMRQCSAILLTSREMEARLANIEETNQSMEKRIDSMENGFDNMEPKDLVPSPRDAAPAPRDAATAPEDPAPAPEDSLDAIWC